MTPEQEFHLEHIKVQSWFAVHKAPVWLSPNNEASSVPETLERVLKEESTYQR